ncbi:SDR family NAD(P)-dependent oxidoreductase [Streptomyces sp. NPDC051569]|uniref:SDR family NAD(P)-dependent oxidoreductase n=1 Tax=Streptomyces sp. NPDC051569 TaxID=3365661 RepID=UPI00379AFDCE
MTGALSGRTALITGGGVGIGKAIALALASAGAEIAVTYRTHAPEPAFVESVRSLTGKPPLAVQLDATSEPDVITAAEVIGKEFGRLNILVNNVGGLVRRSSVKEMDYRLWKDVMAVNLDSLFLVTHHLLPVLDTSGGRVINVASLAGRSGGHAGATAYATAKAAVFGFTRGLAKELAGEGTTVNALAPGFIEATPFHDTFTTAESKAQTIAAIPAGRAGTPEDVADAAVWLASPGAAYVNGTVIDINGAQYFG